MSEENNKQVDEVNGKKEEQKASVKDTNKTASAPKENSKKEEDTSEYKSRLRRSMKNSMQINSLSHIDSRDTMRSSYLENYQKILKLAKTSENKTILNEISRIVRRGYRTLTVPTPKVTPEVSYRKMKETYDRYEELHKALLSNKTFVEEHTKEEKRIAKARHESKTKLDKYERKVKSVY